MFNILGSDRKTSTNNTNGNQTLGNNNMVNGDVVNNNVNYIIGKNGGGDGAAGCVDEPSGNPFNFLLNPMSLLGNLFGGCGGGGGGPLALLSKI